MARSAVSKAVLDSTLVPSPPSIDTYIDLHDSLTKPTTLLLQDPPSTSYHVPLSTLSPQSHILSLSHHWTSFRKTMTLESRRAGLLEGKLSKLLGGYGTRSKGLKKGLLVVFDELVEAERERSSFDWLNSMEVLGSQSRLQDLKEEVQEAHVKEESLQFKYRDLIERKAALQEELDALKIVPRLAQYCILPKISN